MRRSRSSKYQKKDLSVYDFGAEDLAIEEKSAKYGSRISKSYRKKEDKDGSLKYMFLRAFTSGSDCKRTNVDDAPYVDLREDNSPQGSSVDSPERNLSTIEEMSELDENMTPSTSYEERGNVCFSEFDHEDDPLMTGATDLVLPLVGNEQVLNLQSDGTPVDVISDDEESFTSGSTSPSTGTFDHAEDKDYMEHPLSETSFTGDKDNDDLAVIVSPDYVRYENILYGEAEILFFSDSILVKRSDANGNNQNIDLKWTIADIIQIECQWSGSVGAALVKFRLKATTVNRNGKIHDTRDSVELIFSVTDMRWLEKELKIKCLAGRYKDIWNACNHDHSTLEDDTAERNLFFPRHYFTEIPDSFEDVIYPKGDPDAVSISKRDIELLQPDTFLNDTIIDFHIKYLKTKIPLNDRRRFHFFNSFFFRKLADLDKDPGSASEGRAAFLRVRKWTRKVNIFEKDYIFIPVNYNLHWSLLVICHPGEVAMLKEDDVKDSPKVPCILHMDSIKGSHSGLKNLVQSYLLEEWKERHPESAGDYTSKFLNFRFVPLELPQQENSFDCGLFLLQYVELFLEEAPINFNPFKISKFSRFLTTEWFIPSEASFKRSLIRKLIYDLLNDPSQNVISASCSNVHLSPRHPEEDIEQRPAVEFLKEPICPSKTVLDNSTCSITVKGIEMNLETLSPGISDSNKQEQLVVHEFLEPGRRSSSLFKDDTPFQLPKCATCTTEVLEDESEQFNTSILDKDDCRAVGESSATQTCSTSFGLEDVGELDTLLSSMQEKEEFKACNNTPNESSEMGKKVPPSIEKDCGDVPDSPTSFSGENQGRISVDRWEIDVNSCKNSQGDEVTTETVVKNLKFEQINTSQSKDVDADVQKSEMTEDDGKEKHSLEINNYKAVVMSGEDCPIVDINNAVDGEKDKDCLLSKSLPLDDSKDKVIIVNENSSKGKVIMVNENSSVKESPKLKRDEPSTKIEGCHQKRRRVLQPEGDRRRTRSFSKDCPQT